MTSAEIFQLQMRTIVRSDIDELSKDIGLSLFYAAKGDNILMKEKLDELNRKANEPAYLAAMQGCRPQTEKNLETCGKLALVESLCTYVLENE